MRQHTCAMQAPPLTDVLYAPFLENEAQVANFLQSIAIAARFPSSANMQNGSAGARLAPALSWCGRALKY